MPTTNGSLKPTKTTQKAQQYDQRDNKLHLNEIPIPSPKSNELLVKIACASLCHSDMMLFESNDQGLVLGENAVTVGHEATGWIVEIGSEAQKLGFKEGEAVGFIPATECCYECLACKNVHNAWCVKGCKMQGFATDGYFQEYVTVDARAAIQLPSGMDPVESAPLFCAGLTAYHGVEDCKLLPGQWIAIIGCGGLGHLGVKYAKAFGLKVIGLDISETQLQTATAAGADHIFNSMTDKDYVKKIMEITNGGVDAAVNFTASKKAYDDMPAIIRPALGVYMVVGIPREPLQINALDIALGRFKVLGSSNGNTYNMKPAIEFSAKHNIKPDITFFELEDLPKMMDIMHAGKTAGRLAVKFT